MKPYKYGWDERNNWQDIRTYNTAHCYEFVKELQLKINLVTSDFFDGTLLDFQYKIYSNSEIADCFVQFFLDIKKDKLERLEIFKKDYMEKKLVTTSDNFDVIIKIQNNQLKVLNDNLNKIADSKKVYWEEKLPERPNYQLKRVKI